MTSDAAKKADDPESTALAVCVDVPADVALTVGADEPIPLDPPPPFEVCGQCGGPVYFCSGERCNGERCLGAGALEPAELFGLAAMRALFLGTFLCRNVASGYGGVLILVARALVGASVDGSVPAPSERLAELVPHPGYEVGRSHAAGPAWLAFETFSEVPRKLEGKP